MQERQASTDRVQQQMQLQQQESDADGTEGADGDESSSVSGSSQFVKLQDDSLKGSSSALRLFALQVRAQGSRCSCMPVLKRQQLHVHLRFNRASASTYFNDFTISLGGVKLR